MCRRSLIQDQLLINCVFSPKNGGVADSWRDSVDQGMKRGGDVESSQVPGAKTSFSLACKVKTGNGNWSYNE